MAGINCGGSHRVVLVAFLMAAAGVWPSPVENSEDGAATEAPKEVETGAEDPDSGDPRAVSQQYYQQALVSESLGRSAEVRKLLDEAIERWPHNVAARILRNTWEDRQYVLAHAPDADVEVYLEEANWHWVHNRTDDAKAILTDALSIFDKLSIVEVRFDFDPSKISVPEILDSLAADGSGWTCPSWCIRLRSLARDNRILVWNTDGAPARLRFSRYGFEQITIDFPPHSATIPITTMQLKPFLVAATSNALMGTVTLADQTSNSSGIEAVLVDNYGSNLGFSRTTMTGADGKFTVTEIPNGRFELWFSRHGYVGYSLALELRDGELRCLVDARRHYHHPGVIPCNLDELEIRLHPAHEVTLRWLLQDEPEAREFPGLHAVRELRLSSALRHDWRRGGWNCCGSTVRFGNATIDPPLPDLVIFTDTDGVLYFGQPHHHFIAPVEADFEVIDEVRTSLNLRYTARVTEGQTYILKTNQDAEVAFFAHHRAAVKFEVVDVQVRAW